VKLKDEKGAAMTWETLLRHAAKGSHIVIEYQGVRYDLSDRTQCERAKHAFEAAAKAKAPVTMEETPGGPPSPPTAADLTRRIGSDFAARVNKRRLEPYQGGLDFSGAVASREYLHHLLGRTPRAAYPELQAATLALATAIDMQIDAWLSKWDEKVLPSREVRTAQCARSAERYAFLLAAQAAWVEGSFKTFDMTGTLYEELRHACDDESFANMPLAAARAPFSAYALRFPGPDYPRVGDEEIRAVLVYQYDDARRAADGHAVNAAAVEAVRACPAEESLTERDIFEVEATAGMRAFAPEGGPALSLFVAAYEAGTAWDEGTNAILRPTRNAGFANVTVREAIQGGVGKDVVGQDSVERVEVTDAALVAGHREVLTVALATGVYLRAVPDEGLPVRSRAVKTKDGHVSPDVRVLGRLK
jgi:hypothetical protein